MTGKEKIYPAQLELYDPKNRTFIQVEGNTIPLESDFTTPLAYMVGTSEKPKGIQGLLDVDAWDEMKGLYMLEPYDNNKIPVVFTHGLQSSPMTWLRMLNNLTGDEQIRKNYQFWLFMYPTGNPILYSAATLRDSLKAIWQTYDPEMTTSSFSKMVLVGHSMGGILSRLMVQDSGDEVWNAVSDIPVSSLEVPDDTRQLIEKAFFFEALPFVTRAVFIAAPHRGSHWADHFIGDIGASFIKLPVNLATATMKAVTAIGEKSDQTALALESIEKLPTGIDGLSPDNPVTKVTSELPIADWVTYHSIMGNHLAADTPGGTDRVVPYESSHLEGAASEKIVRSGHGAHTHPLAILEVKRILHLHLDAK